MVDKNANRKPVKRVIRVCTIATAENVEAQLYIIHQEAFGIWRGLP